nr:probable protein phosphatase 2C 23 [Ipomoea batatas]
MEKAAAFESSSFFSSIPLQPIPRSSISSVRSGPVPGISGFVSGPVERGFLSGPIERSFTSGPLDIHCDKLHRFKPKSKKSKLVRNFKKLMSNPLYKFGPRDSNPNGSHSNGLSSEGSLVYDEDEEGIEALMAQNVQWAQGKAGEDRVHVVISEEHGLIFVGIYDGFNGPDATDFLLQNLYTNVFKELKRVLWNETKNTTVPLVINHSDVLKGPRLLRENTRRSSRLFSSRSRGKESQSSNKGSIDVGRRLRLLIVIPVIGEVIPIIRAADDGSDEDVRIGRAGVEVLETIAAADAAGMLLHRRHRRAPVVNVLRIPLPKPDHVRHSCRVVAEDVVHLFLRQRDEFVRRERRRPARYSAAVGG